MPFINYTLARFGILAGARVVLYVVGMRGWLWALAGVIVGFALSYLLLGNLRANATTYLMQRTGSKGQAGIAADASYEDEVLDSAATEHES